MGFSGIVACRGRVAKVDRQSMVKLWDGTMGRSHTLTVEADERIVTDKTYVGESICVEGVCLTVTSMDAQKRTFTVDVAGHTLDITTFGDEARGVKEGSPVNLELALPPSQGNSGHEVQVRCGVCVGNCVHLCAQYIPARVIALVIALRFAIHTCTGDRIGDRLALCQRACAYCAHKCTQFPTQTHTPGTRRLHCCHRRKGV